MTMYKIFVTGFAVMMSSLLYAQPPNLQLVKDELYKVNKVFDSSRYLGFDVHIQYSSDTVYGKFEQEEISGVYILNNRNLYYKMANVEFSQNDSFVFNIYHDEKMLMMTKDILTSNSSLFPLKDFVDSIITWYDTAYSITMGNDSDSKVIEFIGTQQGLPYQRFAVYYDEVSHYPERFEMWMQGTLTVNPEMPDSLAEILSQQVVNKKITMRFSNYYNPETLDVFKTENYVYFDRIRKKYRPAEKLKSYRFMANGIDTDEYEESIELKPGGTGQ